MEGKLKTIANLLDKSWLSGVVVISVMLCLSRPLLAQVSEGGKPYTFSNPVADSILTIRMESIDVASLLAEDALEAQQGKHVSPRFGYPFEVNMGLDSAGTWTELPSGDRVWRLRIVAPGAYSINLLYDEFNLSPGAKFFIYNEDRSMVLGAFSSVNNKDHGKFSTGPVQGSVSILEYYEPANVRDKGRLHISRVVHAYRNFFGHSDSGTLNKELSLLDFGDSDTCENNVNCPEGAPWADEKRSVVMVLIADGTRMRSGAIINNTRLDYTPYLLAAFHSIDRSPRDGSISQSEREVAEQWIIMFNYESPDCSDSDGPTNQTVSGTTLLASNVASDFALLELSVTPPAWYDIYYAGWSNLNTAPGSSVCIHHPEGDIKKISFDNDPATSSTWSGAPSNSHWKVIWDDGTTEPGSSGSPLFDPIHRIAGQLDGGWASCSNPDASDYYGKFSRSWAYGGSASSRLKDWLDPDGTAAETLGGMEGPPRIEYLTLANLSMQKAKVYTAVSSVTAGTNTIVETSGDVRFAAGEQITLSPGFHAKAGSNFKAYIDPDLIPPPPPAPTGLCIVDPGVYDDLVELDWSSSPGATSYKVYRQFDDGGWSCIATTTISLYFDDGATVDLEYEFLLEYYVTAVNYGGESGPSNIASVNGYPWRKTISDEGSEIPLVYSLGHAYPNPFNPVTTIRYGLPEASEVTIVVYDIMGREVIRWSRQEPPGYRSLIWNGKDHSGRLVPSGIYLYRIVAASTESDRRFTTSRKMLLLK